MRSCNFCTIRDICVFSETLREALSSHEDKYFSSFTEALCAIEEVVAEHCVYFQPIEQPGEVSE